MPGKQRQRGLAAEFMIGFVDQHQASGVLEHGRERVRIQKGSGGIVRTANNDHI